MTSREKAELEIFVDIVKRAVSQACILAEIDPYTYSQMAGYMTSVHNDAKVHLENNSGVTVQ